MEGPFSSVSLHLLAGVSANFPAKTALHLLPAKFYCLVIFMELILSLKGFTVSMTPYNMTIAYDSYEIIPKRTFIFCKTIGSFDKLFCQSSRVSFYPGCSVEWKVFEIMQFKTKWSIKETTGRLDRMSHRKWRETKHQPSRARSDHQLNCCLLPSVSCAPSRLVALYDRRVWKPPNAKSQSKGHKGPVCNKACAWMCGVRGARLKTPTDCSGEGICVA